MGEVKLPTKVRLFTGLLAASHDELSHVEKLLEEVWGPIEDRSQIIPFNYSHYYDEELGSNILREYCSFERCLDQLDILDYKLKSNEIEQSGSVQGQRRWNIDPGFIDLDKIVLATTKPATYRIYIGRGIFAQCTLFFKDGSFHPWPWTYRDYKEDMAIQFFNRVRNRFKKQIFDNA